MALVEAHWVEQQHKLLCELLFDARFVGQVDDVVVEFGNARYQALIDRYIGGETVPEGDLERVWTETIGGRRSRVFESPVYAVFFHAVRRSRHIRASDRPRVLLGDPPFDPDSGEPVRDRDEHFAAVVEREVLARDRRALVLAGGGHLGRVSDVPGGNVVQRLEHVRPGSCTVVFTHYTFRDVAVRRAGELEQLESRLSSWPVPSLARIRETWLSDVDATLLLGDRARVIDPDGSEREVEAAPFLAEDGTPLPGATLGDVADFYLYLGPLAQLTLIAPPSGKAT